MSKRAKYIPVTPGGTVLFDLSSRTREKAIEKLIADTAFMGCYGSWAKLSARGYTVEKFVASECTREAQDD